MQGVFGAWVRTASTGLADGLQAFLRRVGSALVGWCGPLPHVQSLAAFQALQVVDAASGLLPSLGLFLAGVFVQSKACALVASLAHSAASLGILGIPFALLVCSNHAESLPLHSGGCVLVFVDTLQSMHSASPVSCASNGSQCLFVGGRTVGMVARAGDCCAGR